MKTENQSQAIIERISELLEQSSFGWSDVLAQVEIMISGGSQPKTSLEKKEAYKDSIVARFNELKEQTVNGKHYSATAISVIIAEEQGKTQQAIQRVLKSRNVAFLGKANNQN